MPSLTLSSFLEHELSNKRPKTAVGNSFNKFFMVLNVSIYFENLVIQPRFLDQIPDNFGYIGERYTGHTEIWVGKVSCVSVYGHKGEYPLENGLAYNIILNPD